MKHLQIIIEIPTKQVGYIVGGALEGGSDYWIECVEAINMDGSEYTGKGEFKSDVIEQGDGKLIIITRPYCDHKGKHKFRLTQEGLIKGLQAYAKDDGDLDFDRMDAGSYDRILQYALFGKVIFG